jgi:hypothetical protein
MTEEDANYGELGLTEKQKDEAWDHVSMMQSDIEDKPAGKQLGELFKNADFTLGQKMYIAYIFGRTEDRYRELRHIEYDAQ